MPDTKYVTMTLYMWTVGVLIAALSGIFGMLMTYRDEVFTEISGINVSIGVIQANMKNMDDKLDNYEVVN